MAHAQASPLPLVYVATLTWNQREDTLACLRSLRAMTYPNYRLVVVDNASQDNTVAAVRDGFPEVEVMVNATNLGFSGGFNVGLQYALDKGADFVFMINNDTAVAPDILDELVAYRDWPHAGVFAPKIYYAGEPTRIWSVGGNRNPLNFEMIGKGDKQLDHGQWDKVIERDYLVGCALLLRRSLLKDIGLFDTAYAPIYYEDIDFCVRARQAGYCLLLVPSAHMWHKVAASGGGIDSPRERYLMARNSVLFFRKHIRGWRWLIVVPFRLGSAVKTTLRLLFRRRLPALSAYWRGLYDGLRRREAGRA